MSIEDREGVIKYDLVFERKSIQQPLDLSGLIAWRTVLHKLKLIGQDPQRYRGLDFGNISKRIGQGNSLESTMNRFVISGTQTGVAERLANDQFCIVTESCIRQNRIVAEGLIKPSSEALTHASVYRCHPDIHYVMHVHSPDIWRTTKQLSTSFIEKTIAYGTPAMADAVQKLILSQESCPSGFFSMLGHEDGILSYGNSAEIAGRLIIDALTRSLSLSLDCSRQ